MSDDNDNAKGGNEEKPQSSPVRELQENAGKSAVPAPPERLPSTPPPPPPPSKDQEKGETKGGDKQD